MFRQSTGDWFSAGRTIATGWGEPGDLPFADDLDRDGYDEIGVFRPSTKTWLARRTLATNWDEPDDLPLAGNLS